MGGKATHIPRLSAEGRGLGCPVLRYWLAIAGGLLLAASAAQAQQQAPRIGYVCPAGGQRGTTFEVTVGGQFLDGVSTARVSGSGVKTKIVEHIKPLTQGQASALRERLAELQKQRRDPEVQREIAEIRKRLATFVRKPAAPAIAETVIVQVTLDANAAVGDRELRLMTPVGVSSPLVFCVGQLPEYNLRPPSSENVVQAISAVKRRNDPGRATPSGPAVEVTLPITVNGQILPGECDRYRFRAEKGQRIVIAAAARKLIPYIADAVPGWIQAVMTLTDANGKEISYADDFRFNPDPIIACEIPRSGAYTLEVRDSIYRGREDFVYRIAMGELPLITSVFPRGCKTGTQVNVELKGWNLPAGSVLFDARDKAPGNYPLQVSRGGIASNTLPFAVDALPEFTEKISPPGQGNAQPLTLPVIVNGRIERAGQADVFCFEGKAGEEVVAEVVARRLDSPLDSALRLTDAAGKQLAANDDHEDKGSGLNTHHADSYIRTKLPAAGTYFLYLHDVQQQGGPECSYRLRVSPPQPDFELRLAPSAVNVRAGTSAAVTVHALRKDGFAGEINLVLKNAPAGYKISGGTIPAGQDQVRMSITAPVTGTRDLVTPVVEGSAKIDGRIVTRPAVPAEDMMQAFAYRHLVCAKELDVAVSKRMAARAEVRILSNLPLKIPSGGTAAIRVTMPAQVLFGDVELELSEPPPGISIRRHSQALVGSEVVFAADASKLKPGFKGNLIVNMYITPRRSPDAPPPTSAPATTTAPATKPATALATASAPAAGATNLAPTSRPAAPVSTPATAPAVAAKGPTPLPAVAGRGPTSAPAAAPAPPPPPRQPARRPFVGVLPAIPFEIVER